MPLPTELVEEIKKTIADGEKRLPELKKEIERAKLALIPVDELIKERTELEKKITAMKLQYGK